MDYCMADSACCHPQHLQNTSRPECRWSVMILTGAGPSWRVHEQFDSLDEAEAEKMRLELSWPSPIDVMIERRETSVLQSGGA